ncbi:hypothetical protein [Planctomycetes bacterium Pan216]
MERSAQVETSRTGEPKSHRLARVVVADYARAHGLDDPDQVASLARECLGEAVYLLGADADPRQLIGESLERAIERLKEQDELARRSPRRGAPQSVPPTVLRDMPAQRLGELPAPLRSTSMQGLVVRLQSVLASGLLLLR